MFSCRNNEGRQDIEGYLSGSSCDTYNAYSRVDEVFSAYAIPNFQNDLNNEIFK